jgi:hypothetical protein
MNSVISTPGAKFMGIDLKISTSTIPRKEYVRIPINIIPEVHHRLQPPQIRPPMDSSTLKWSRHVVSHKTGRVANDALVKQLAADYHPLDSPRTIQAHYQLYHVRPRR